MGRCSERAFNIAVVAAGSRASSRGHATASNPAPRLLLQLEATNRGPQEKLRDFVNERLTITRTISPDLLDQVILTDAHWRDFLNMFNQAHPLFLVALNARYPSLTQSETRLCCLTYLSLSDREMADMLGVDTNAIRITRNRVRKKLLIDGDQDLRAMLKTM
jgi:DNA-binding CsgD family transcriptional regulator